MFRVVPPDRERVAPEESEARREGGVAGLCVTKHTALPIVVTWHEPRDQRGVPHPPPTARSEG